ncbi:biotin biosynthesis protein BioY [Bifidobacterium primatium]|uniref:Biotin transporter n=1 Tax=Bifidobacterium primatium TaxID=2045438 RepID=A0A2M9H920_9BIFI|nr:biotin transporter BioY [Bifidobacterium primatium]PJM73312.1 biotin biosynthesis protein BioY [Bifidobacterium primatium]
MISQHHRPALDRISRTADAVSARRLLVSGAKALLFAGLMWAAAAAGEIPVPGTPVPITMQTFVLMLAALTLSWREAASAVATYLMAGAAGLPVFAGGASTLALVGPSAGFLIGFLPAAVITALVRGEARTDSARGRVLTALRYFGAIVLGVIVVLYPFGAFVQSVLTGVPFAAVMTASLGFLVGDLPKAVIVSAVCAGIARRR